jgi:Fe-S oxidoreductase
MLGRFERLARNNARQLRALATNGASLVGVDPSITLTYRDEYRKALGEDAPPVLLLQEFLAANLPEEPPLPLTSRLTMLPHCTERSLAQASLAAWKKVFRHFGIELDIAQVGCCGMAGTYGHEASHRETSKRIFDLSWAPALAGLDRLESPMATGYSCRCQAERFGVKELPHPAQVLLPHVARSPAPVT